MPSALSSSAVARAPPALQRALARHRAQSVAARPRGARALGRLALRRTHRNSVWQRGGALSHRCASPSAPADVSTLTSLAAMPGSAQVMSQPSADSSSSGFDCACERASVCGASIASRSIRSMARAGLGSKQAYGGWERGAAKSGRPAAARSRCPCIRTFRKPLEAHRRRSKLRAASRAFWWAPRRGTRGAPAIACARRSHRACVFSARDVVAS
jgi:hypothetical protein